jgi:hypothetical protein
MPCYRLQQMRALVLICLCFACEDDGPLDSEKDMAQIQMPDLSAGTATCFAALKCSMACTGASAGTCSAACFGNVDSAAQPFAMALLTCIEDKCTSLGGDGGSTDCDDPQSTTCTTCVTSKCGSEATACAMH